MEIQPLLIEAPRRERGSGVHHDLQRLAEEVRLEYFPMCSPLPVRWGKRTEKRRRRSIRLGSYHHASTVIRVHPLLDDPSVPRFFVQSIIHHEYLHHVLGGAHNRRFHAHERRFRYFRESKLWLRHNLSVLLGRKRSVAARPRMSVLKPVAEPQSQLALF